MVEPSRATTPTRAPIEVLCDERTAPRLARVAVRRGLLRGGTGLFLLVMAVALAIIGSSVLTPVIGVPAAVVMLAAQVVAAQRSAVRSFRRMAPPGQILRTAYDDRTLCFTTAIGSTALAPGSVDRVESLGDCLHLRMLPGRRWALLPAALLTDDDLAFLLGSHGAAPGAAAPDNPATAGRGEPAPRTSSDLTAPGSPTPGREALPLLHVVTPQSRRALQSAVAARAWHSRSGRFLTACLVLAIASSALVHDAVTFSLLAVVAVIVTLAVTAPVLAVRRQRPVGHLVRAAVTATHLAVQEQDSRSTIPWRSVRGCTATRNAVLLDLTSGVVLPLPRDLFPDAELARMQQLLRAASAPTS